MTAGVTAAFSFLCAATACGAEQPDKPNIIFILADDLGYGDVGCYGAEKIKTPNIDKLAEKGILFADAHTECSTCTPTRYGPLTGRYCLRTWLKYSALSTSAPLLIEEDRVTAASFLKSAGYSTSIVGKWHLGYGREEGFEDNRGDTPPNYWETRKSGPNWNGELKPGPLEVGFDYSYVIPIANSFPPYVFVVSLLFTSPIHDLAYRCHRRQKGRVLTCRVDGHTIAGSWPATVATCNHRASLAKRAGGQQVWTDHGRREDACYGTEVCEVRSEEASPSRRFARFVRMNTRNIPSIPPN
jgi:hypothetical protein